VGLSGSTDATVRELLDRFERGDYLGALAIADRTLEDKRVPVVVVPCAELGDYALDARETFFLAMIDGIASLETLLETCGLPMLDALRIFCDLVEKGVVSLEERAK
jgi:hypothetical protein